MLNIKVKHEGQACKVRTTKYYTTLMVVSAGIDMVEVVRIRRALDDPKIGGRFRDRVYTEKEIRYCESRGKAKYESYAGRFAAKEAVMKALGRGWGSKVSWVDIEVAPSAGGKPEICLRSKAAAFARELGIHRFSLSITHTEQYAMAYVIAEHD
jgi:holo-[acyl-carrier protein] synthase